MSLNQHSTNCHSLNRRVTKRLLDEKILKYIFDDTLFDMKKFSCERFLVKMNFCFSWELNLLNVYCCGLVMVVVKRSVGFSLTRVQWVVERRSGWRGRALPVLLHQRRRRGHHPASPAVFLRTAEPVALLGRVAGDAGSRGPAGIAGQVPQVFRLVIRRLHHDDGLLGHDRRSHGDLTWRAGHFRRQMSHVHLGCTAQNTVH